MRSMTHDRVNRRALTSMVVVASILVAACGAGMQVCLTPMFRRSYGLSCPTSQHRSRTPHPG